MPDLATHINAQIDAILSGKTAGASQYIFSTADDANGTYTYNATGIGATFVTGLTGVSAVTSNPTYPHSQGGVLLSPQYVAMAVHVGNPASITYVESGGTVRTRNVVDYRQISGTDILICKLDSALPSGIHTSKLLPSNYANYFRFDANGNMLDAVRCLFVDRDKQINVALWYAFATTNGVLSPDGYTSWYKPRESGTSGNPIGFLINGEWVGLGTFYFGTSFPQLATRYTAICTAIFQMGGTSSDYPTTLDLSAFDTYTIPSPPTDTGGPNMATIVKIKPDGTGDYTTLQALIDAMNGGLYFSGPFIPQVTADLYAGNCGTLTGSGSVNSWNIGTLTITSSTAKPGLTDQSDTGVACVVMGGTGSGIATFSGANGSNGGLYTSGLIFDGIQIGSDSQKAALTIQTTNEFTNAVVRNCRFKTGIANNSSGVGLTNMVKGSANAANSTIDIHDNTFVSSFTQATGTVRAINADVAASGTGSTIRVNNNSVFTDNLRPQATGCIHVTSASGIAFTFECQYNLAIGSATTPIGFAAANSGTMTLAGTSGGNVSTDTTSSMFGGSYLATTAAKVWITPGTNFKTLATSPAKQMGTTATFSADYNGTARPQGGTVEAGAYQSKAVVAGAGANSVVFPLCQ